MEFVTKEKEKSEDLLGKFHLFESEAEKKASSYNYDSVKKLLLSYCETCENVKRNCPQARNGFHIMRKATLRSQRS